MRTKPIRSSGRDSTHGEFRASQCLARIVLKVVSLRRRQRRAGFVAFAIVDDAQLVPGERVLVIAAHGPLEDLLGFGEILRIFRRNERVTEHGGCARRGSVRAEW